MSGEGGSGCQTPGQAGKRERQAQTACHLGLAGEVSIRARAQGQDGLVITGQRVHVPTFLLIPLYRSPPPDKSECRWVLALMLLLTVS